MIVHNEETLEEALQMVRAEGSVRYSDRYAYIIITSPETLEYLSRKALRRGDVAVVHPLGAEGESHTQALAKVKKQRVAEEKKKIREWVKEHPEIAEASAENIPKLVRQIRKRQTKRLNGEKGGVSS